MTPLRTKSSETTRFNCRSSISMLRSTQSQPMIRSGSPSSALMRAKSSSRSCTTSTLLAMVSTSPSSIAQKKVRLLSGLTFWIDRTWYNPPTLTISGWAAKTRGDSEADDARIFEGRRLCIELGDNARARIGAGDHHLAIGIEEMLGLEDRD